MKIMDAEHTLKLEIWRELYRARPAIYPGGIGGQGSHIPVPDPVATAKNAQIVYDTLYPAKRKQR